MRQAEPGLVRARVLGRARAAGRERRARRRLVRRCAVRPGAAAALPARRHGRAQFSRDRYWWRGAASDAQLRRVPPDPRGRRPRACRCRSRSPPATARDGLVLPRRDPARHASPTCAPLADRAAVAGDGAPWEEAGRLIARCHRAGLDHADLNAHNMLFDRDRQGLDHRLRPRRRLRHPGDRLARAQPGAPAALAAEAARRARGRDDVERDFARLRDAYDRAWERGY